jgi:8-amino-3,8-dideoxy-alpha-D-manno-octulosonate transaminase
MFAHGFDARRNGVFKVREFERAVADAVGVKYAQAVSSGSTAVLVGLQALGVGRGDEVITQSFTFVATVEAILLTGATPVVVEIDRSLNIDPQRLAERITEKTKAIVPVHMAGAPADMDAVTATAAAAGIPVLEDTAQAFGGTWHGRPLGSVGNAGAVSFDFAKNLTTGEGGMVLTDDESVYLRARALHDHGHEYNRERPRGKDTRSGPGFNYRLSEPQAAIGLAQLAKLDEIVRRQRENKAALTARLAPLGLDFRELRDAEGDSGDTLIFFLESEERALAAAESLGRRGIGTHNLPDALDWHFAATWQHLLPWLTTNCACHPGADACACGDLLRRAIALPVRVLMDDAEIERVAQGVEEAVA